MAGGWDPLSRSTLKKVTRVMENPLRKAVMAASWYREGEHRPTNKAVRQVTRSPRVEAVLIVEQLRLAARILGKAAPAMLALAQSRGAERWRAQLLTAAAVVKQVLGKKLDSLGSPDTCFQEWEKFWRAWPRQWCSLLRRFLQEVTAHEDHFVAACSTHGYQTVDLEVESEVDMVFPCSFCGKFFESKGAKDAHERTLHHVRHVLRNKVAGTVCRFCLTDYHTRPRLRVHLTRGRGVCVRAALALPDLPADVAAAENEAERVATRDTRAQGKSELAGLPAVRLLGPLPRNVHV